MSPVELGLLGVASFPEPSVPSGWSGETLISRAAVLMVVLNGPVIRASWLRAEGRVVASGLLGLMLMGSVGLVPVPVPEVEELVLV